MNKGARRAAVTGAVGLAAGALSAWIAVAGDGDGLNVTEASRFASGYVPYAAVVLLVSATAPTAVHAVLRAVLSQLIMVWGYYTWGPMITFERTPTQAAHYAREWATVAVTAVPAAALGTYALARGARRLVTPRAGRAGAVS
ncbi:hypothetical protein ACFZBM_36420 [Streptomyces lavendulae]|uniref:Uncharacterized protein n=1 Tax=Streptomyces lavendulae subsp. lavendulae TaxID=58340 RepID=A0A2K8P6S5_STRLA|nr:hypothetical protein [Streptomyces lavendulae]ATZ22168.1 hypothetical protein SLAV_01195 [Streptomyces lavendulae subsp. lavendulae]GLV87771.1 hypothetical protein Slala03_74600 [Streptomyces lavendulae subsp. lavendulae]GLW04594.1 hypothetical protein Slala05_82240 [Streptomyces lavendulae subsp. lavendulae]